MANRRSGGKYLRIIVKENFDDPIWAKNPKTENGVIKSDSVRARCVVVLKQLNVLCFINFAFQLEKDLIYTPIWIRLLICMQAFLQNVIMFHKIMLNH